MQNDLAIKNNGLAFGVDPRRSEKFSSRQSRYYEISLDIAQLSQLAKEQGKRLRLLDIGVGTGVSMRYIEAHEEAENVDYHGVDLVLGEGLYKRERWSELQEGDLTQGLPLIESDQFDVVICEQVLEHLDQIDLAISTLHRVLKPGGTLIVGVPIFPPGVHLLRRYLVPILDRVFRVKKQRGHVQAFSKNSFIAALRKNCSLEIQQTRGFRIVSGGLLKPLENHRWWWRGNRFLGTIVPSLCIETQVVAKKPMPIAASNQPAIQHRPAA